MRRVAAKSIFRDTISTLPDGLGQFAEQRWVAWGARTPLTVIGPTGVERMVNGFNEAHALNGIYRTAHHGPDAATPWGFGLIAQPFDLADGDGSTGADLLVHEAISPRLAGVLEETARASGSDDVAHIFQRPSLLPQHALGCGRRGIAGPRARLGLHPLHPAASATLPGRPISG